MLSGKMLKEGVLSAARHLSEHTEEVDALNVFPVPDGDTGTNMTMTLTAAADELSQLEDESTFDEAAERAASAMLRSARGNSGVILSLIFRGFAKAVEGVQHLDGAGLAQALAQGSEAAYKAVIKPVEGTILTVVREAAQRAKETAQSVADAVAVWHAALEAAKETLGKTPSLLPALRQAGVVDAGGQGLVYIMEGLMQGFLGQDFDENNQPVLVARPRPRAVISDENITFTYCTEFLVNRAPDAPAAEIETLRLALMGMGDSLVLADAGDVLKGHIHSNCPGEVLSLALTCGPLAQVKVENMRIQHEQAAWAKPQQTGSDEPGKGPAESVEVAPEKRYGIVAVAVGEGLSSLLCELGADEVVSGGQSMNPSTQELLLAVNRVPAEHVFLLPNNKNIVMAAEQVAALTSKELSVLPTHSVVQGIAAVLEFDESASAAENYIQMQDAALRAQTGLVTYAVRESNVDGLEITNGAIIGLENGKLTLTAEDPVAAAFEVTQHLIGQCGGSIVSIYAGADATEEMTAALLDKLEEAYGGEIELSAAQGGQPLYYYMIGVE